MNPRPGGRRQKGLWAALLCVFLCTILCGCQSAAEPETMEVQEPAIQAASVPEPEPEPEPEPGSSVSVQEIKAIPVIAIAKRPDKR